MFNSNSLYFIDRMFSRTMADATLERTFQSSGILDSGEKCPLCDKYHSNGEILEVQKFLTQGYGGPGEEVRDDWHVKEAECLIGLTRGEPDCMKNLIMYAAFSGHDKVIEMVLKGKEVQVNDARVKDGTTPLFFAAQNGHDNVVNLLLKHEGIDVNKAKNDGATPLLIASQNGHGRVVELLLEKNALVNKARRDGASPLMMASRKGHQHIVKHLLKHPQIAINIPDGDGKTPCDWAHSQGHHPIVRLLRDLGGESGITLNEAKVNYLIANGGDINQPDQYGWPPLVRAADMGDQKVLSLLLNHKAIKVNVRNKRGDTALIRAAAGGYLEVVAILLGRSAVDANHSTFPKVKHTAVGLAAEYGHHEVLELLLKVTDSNTINQMDAHESTPLIYAAKRGYSKVVEVLLRHPGLEVDMKGGLGKSALNWAKERGHNEVANLICRHKLGRSASVSEAKIVTATNLAPSEQ